MPACDESAVADTGDVAKPASARPFCVSLQGDISEIESEGDGDGQSAGAGTEDDQSAVADRRETPVPWELPPDTPHLRFPRWVVKRGTRANPGPMEWRFLLGTFERYL